MIYKLSQIARSDKVEVTFNSMVRARIATKTALVQKRLGNRSGQIEFQTLATILNVFGVKRL